MRFPQNKSLLYFLSLAGLSFSFSSFRPVDFRQSYKKITVDVYHHSVFFLSIYRLFILMYYLYIPTLSSALWLIFTSACTYYILQIKALQILSNIFYFFCNLLKNLLLVNFAGWYFLVKYCTLILCRIVYFGSIL